MSMEHFFIAIGIICSWLKMYINFDGRKDHSSKCRFNMIVWFFWPQHFDLAANPINFTWVVCSRGSQGQIPVMQNDKGVSIKYLQEARSSFQYRANSNISAHALSWKRKEDATVPGKDKSAQRNSNVFIKRSQSKSEGKQSMGIYFHLCQMQMVLASSLFYIFIQSLYVFVLTCTQGVPKKCKNHTWYLSRTPQTASV